VEQRDRRELKVGATWLVRRGQRVEDPYWTLSWFLRARGRKTLKSGKSEFISQSAKRVPAKL
jgi:hypothetical protein